MPYCSKCGAELCMHEDANSVLSVTLAGPPVFEPETHKDSVYTSSRMRVLLGTF